jgi:hypothetical protein
VSNAALMGQMVELALALRDMHAAAGDADRAAGGRARSFDVVQMKAPDVGELRRLVRSASPTRVVAHKHADTLASMTSDNVRRRVAAAKTGTLCPNGRHLKS